MISLHCVSKKRANFETVYLKIITIDFDKIWQKYSKDSRRVCMFQFSCRFAFFINFLSFKPDMEINANFDTVSSKRANFDECIFF